MKTPRRARLVPEVLQSSMMDCGPAALKAVLAGFGIEVDYDLLRERCETDVDGTSMDALAQLGSEFGLDSKQVLAPREHLLLREANCLPAIVVTRSAAGALHFIVVWNTVGPWVQILDPGAGRHWLRREAFLAQVPDLPVVLSKARFRRWAGTRAAHGAWRRRLRQLGLRGLRAEALLGWASADSSWCSFARLDAGLRMAAALVQAGAVSRGGETRELLNAMGVGVAAGSESPVPDSLEIGPRFWWASEAGAPPDKLLLRGGVIVRFARRPASLDRVAPLAQRSLRRPTGSVDADLPRTIAASAPPAVAARARLEAPPPHPAAALSVAPAAPADHGRAALPPACLHWLSRTRQAPLRALWSLLWVDAAPGVLGLGCAVAASSALVPVELLLLRGLMDPGRQLNLNYQWIAALGALSALMLLALWIEAWAAFTARGLGRRLEMRLRLALLERLPRLEDKYLRTRPSADMAGRVHALQLLRELPSLWLQLARATGGLLFTCVTLTWLFPQGGLLPAFAVLVALAVPFLGRRSLSEASLRLRTHAGALDQFYLDALLGASPIRVHGAERAVRTEHEALLTQWSRTAQQLHGKSQRVQAVQLLSSTMAVTGLVLLYVAREGALAKLLIVALLAARVPAHALELTGGLQALRNLRGVALRLVSPLAARVSSATDSVQSSPSPPGASVSSGEHALEKGTCSAPPRSSDDRGIGVSLNSVSVYAGGHPLLADVTLAIEPGEQIAIVGASGAGKSSLLGLLLGWLQPSTGELRVEGRALDDRGLASLRLQTAWVDPAVQLWEQSLYDNLTFGDDAEPQAGLPRALAAADLLELLERLPEGMQSNLGESGACVSGGQGQRVRIGRALMRRHARLVLLDEPFRGLERPRRRQLSERLRAHWPGATLLLVTHDVRESLAFPRVLVLDNGHIAEDGNPQQLRQNAAGAYSRLLHGDKALETELWAATEWRRLALTGGRLQELRKRELRNC